MLKEIYHRIPEEGNFVTGFLEHSSALEAYVSKIKMILNTSKGEVLGFPEFGVNLENLVFELNYSTDQLRYEILTQINKYCGETEYFETEVQVTFARGTARDLALIDILIDATKMISVLLR